MKKQTTDLVFEQRREFLVNALTAGVLVGGYSTSLYADVLGKRPKRLAPGKSIFSLNGNVFVNGKAASLDTRIKAADTITTGRKSNVVFAVGKDAFILRSNSEMTLSGTEFLLTKFKLTAGRLLGVFGKRRRSEQRLVATTATATIGIRGTGVYFESEPDLSYVCTCYGSTSIVAKDDPDSRENVTSLHHDKPLYVAGDGAKGKRIKAAPFKNHTDIELMFIEEIVGRTPPFSGLQVDYGAPQRKY